MQKISPFSAEVTQRCPLCHQGTRAVFGKVGTKKRREIPLLCACEAKRREELEAEHEAHTQEKMDAMRYAIAFGDRVLQGSFTDTDGRNLNEMEACRSYAENFATVRNEKTNGLLLCGESRVGKTYAAEATAGKVHAQGFSVLFDTAAGYVQRLQHGDHMKVEALRHRIATCDLLVVDDFGASRDTSFGRETVFSIIDMRVSAKGAMIVTTNIPYHQMMNATDIDDKRINSRITERCIPLEFMAQQNMNL